MVTIVYKSLDLHYPPEKNAKKECSKTIFHLQEQLNKIKYVR